METRYLTLKIRADGRKHQRHVTSWRACPRMALLALAAMIFARLVMLMIDVIQLHAATAGTIAIPAYVAVLIYTGWKLKEWTAQGKESNEKCPITESARSAGTGLTRASGATAMTSGMSGSPRGAPPRMTEQRRQCMPPGISGPSKISTRPTIEGGP